MDTANYDKGLVSSRILRGFILTNVCDKHESPPRMWMGRDSKSTILQSMKMAYERPDYLLDRDLENCILILYNKIL
jgi:hypothetical protein